MRSNTLLPSLAVLGAGAFAWPTKGGDVTIKSFQLYPENADYYAKLDRVYISVLYNSSVAVWDPTNNVIESIIEFPETNKAEYHASGIEVEAETGLLSAIINPGAAFDTSGEDISGVSWLYKIDMETKEVRWRKDVSAPTNGAYGGCQEAIHDRHHNTYVLCTYPGAIIKVSADGKTATSWYTSNYMKPGETPQRPGLTGGVSWGDYLLAVDDESHKLLRFDMREEKGNPVVVKIGNDEDVGLGLDGAYLPPKYEGRVLLVTSESKEINVIISNDNWETAEKAGVIKNTYWDNPENNRGFSVSTVQIGDKYESPIYSINEYFLDAQDASKPTVPGTLAKDRSEFPLQDITEALEKIVWPQ